MRGLTIIDKKKYIKIKGTLSEKCTFFIEIFNLFLEKKSFWAHTVEK